jgi:hypothetical protein
MVTSEIKEELFKWLNDTPAYAAIILAKLNEPVTDLTQIEQWAYDHAWFWLIVYRFSVIAFDIHKKLMQPIEYNTGEEVIMISGYKKIYLVLKKIMQK